MKPQSEIEFEQTLKDLIPNLTDYELAEYIFCLDDGENYGNLIKINGLSYSIDFINQLEEALLAELKHRFPNATNLG